MEVQRNFFPQKYDDDDQIEQQIFGTENQFEKASTLEEGIQFEVKALQRIQKVSNEQPKYIPGIISIKINEQVQLNNNQHSRVGVDLICLIDKSGSMRGKKLKMVQNTLSLLLENLNEYDRLQLIYFDNTAKRITNLRKMTQENKQYFKNIIQQGIVASGRTSIGSATQIAFQQIEQRRYQNQVTSIFLLSDGGDVKAQKEVALQLKNYQQQFTIHSFGFGADHNAQMMTQICGMKNGSFYFVKDIQLLDEFFIDALGGLISVVGKELQITINCDPQKPYDNVQICKTYGNMWKQEESKKQYTITIPQISAGTRKDFVFELKIPQFTNLISDIERNAKIIHAHLQIKNSINGEIIIKECELQMTFFNYNEKVNDSEEDIDVKVQYQRVKATDSINEARKACELNQYQKAQLILNQQLQQILNDEQMAERSQGIIQDLYQARQGSDKQTYQLYGQKQMYQIMNNNYAQQGINSNFTLLGAQIPQKFQGSFQNERQIEMMQLVQEIKKKK